MFPPSPLQFLFGCKGPWAPLCPEEGDHAPLPVPLALPCPPPASGDFAKEEAEIALLPSPSKPSWCLNHCKTLADVLGG